MSEMSSFMMFNQPSELKILEEKKKNQSVYYGEAESYRSSFAMFNQPSELKRLEELREKQIFYCGEAETRPSFAMFNQPSELKRLEELREKQRLYYPEECRPPFAMFNRWSELLSNNQQWLYNGELINDETKAESVLKKEEKKQEVACRNNIIDAETKAESVCKSNLKRKGLPLDTNYEYVDKPHKAYDEPHCHMLYETIEEKKKNPEHPPPAPPSLDFSTAFTFVCAFDERKSEHKVCGDVNAILYARGSDGGRKRYYLPKESYKKNDEKFKELQAKGIVPPGCVRLPMPLMPDYE